MRTTVDIDEDVMIAARALAKHNRRSIGQILSDLSRRGLKRDDEPPRYRNGILLLPVRDRHAVVTLEMVNRLRDEDP